jgi:DNA replication protein DnaC
MIQHEFTERATHRLAMRLRWAKLPISACIEDIDTRSPRGPDPAQFAQVSDLGWIREHLNVLITGPTGVGKSYLGAALAHSACRADFSVRCFRLPRLVEELARTPPCKDAPPSSGNWPKRIFWCSMTSVSLP